MDVELTYLVRVRLVEIFEVLEVVGLLLDEGDAMGQLSPHHSRLSTLRHNLNFVAFSLVLLMIEIFQITIILTVSNLFE